MSTTEQPADQSRRAEPTVLVKIIPDGEIRRIKRPKTALQLLHALNLGEERALVIRMGKLLTPDRRIWPNDELTVRVVASRG